ncbi:MAG: FAD-dependent oxidoreductase [Thermoleophilia bacterium]|nr:FAD-dependent oxidoreductase [Thermoleophilia bacterium]
MTAQTYVTSLLDKVTRAADTKSFRFARPTGYTFTAGQFLQLILSTEPNLVHAFSHADSPTEAHIEVTTRLTGSEYKNALDALPLGAEVQIKGPYGKFVFAYDRPRVAFLTGGIGITPVRSMLKYLVDTGGAERVPGQQIVLFYGSRTVDGIVYREELEQFASQLAGFRLVHVISQPEAGWEGHVGHITAHLIRSEIDFASTWTYYVVGPPGMVAAMDKVLDELGVPSEQRVTEQFAGYDNP